MHDTLDERLAQLGGSLEDTVGVQSPTAVRSRGEQFRVAHRRRVTAVTATSAAVVIVGVGSLVALGPGNGHRGSTVGPGLGGSATTTSKPFRTLPSDTAAPSNETSPSKATPTASAKATVVVDLERHTMTVRDKSGQIVKTFPVSGGDATHPSKVGTYTIAAKEARKTISSTTVGVPASESDTYILPVYSVIELDGGGPLVYAAPWAIDKVGQVNSTHGDIDLTDESAQWLYDHVTVGDRIQIQ